jgi:hypothetical protein
MQMSSLQGQQAEFGRQALDNHELPAPGLERRESRSALDKLSRAKDQVSD